MNNSQITSSHWDAKVQELDTVIPRSQLVALNDEPDLRSQSVTSSAHGGRSSYPYAFTEQGVTMLLARVVLHVRVA